MEVTNKQCNLTNSDILLITGIEKSMQNYEENIMPAKVVMSIWDWW